MSIGSRIISFFAWIYILFLFSWLLAYLLGGDRLGVLGLVNYAAVYLFFPLPVVLLAAWAVRSPQLAVAFVLGLAAFLGLWGRDLLPNAPAARAGRPSISILTYNVLAWHTFTEPILENIRAENPDVVCVQELNPTLARALEQELGQIYPYQVLEPAGNPRGIGVISKYPLRQTGERLPHPHWIGGPLVLELDWEGQAVTLVNFHMVSTSGMSIQATAARDFQYRAEQAWLLADFARTHRPAVLCGDANSVPIGDAYRILSGNVQDAWREAGSGLGHTFPGSTVPGSDRPRLGRWYAPRWLWRIDYVFYSQDWVAVDSRLARFDGVSDHRGVIAVLESK